jgi:hypothetical protein
MSVDRFETRITKLGHPVDIVYKAMPGDTHAERFYCELPPDFYSSEEVGFRRLLVEEGSTAFFSGTEFRTFWDFSIPASETRVIEVVAGVDTLVKNFKFEIDTGKVQLELWAGGTATGPFNVPWPIQKTNQMSFAGSYSSAVTMTNGGTGYASDGVLADILRADASSKGSAATVGQDQPVGFSVGTYYLVFKNLVNNTTATGIFYARWEERA